jgi:hypothetical protein
MSCEIEGYEPFIYVMPAITQGDTYPAWNISITECDTTLARVRQKFRLSGATSAALILDSDDTGITIDTASGTWAFTMDVIAATTTQGLAAGNYSYDIETTDNLGTVKTWIKGNWKILPQITD